VLVLLLSETPSIDATKTAGAQLPGLGELQKQQLQMLLQAKMLQQGQANAASNMAVTEPVTSSPTDWSSIFGGNTANTGASTGTVYNQN
jgi:hypothetical protein